MAFPGAAYVPEEHPGVAWDRALVFSGLLSADTHPSAEPGSDAVGERVAGLPASPQLSSHREKPTPGSVAVWV